MIYDTDDNRIFSVAFAVESEQAATAMIRVDCNAGYYLRGEAVANLTVEARADGDVSWIDIETTPIDLTPYDGTFQDFELRFTAPEITAFSRAAFSLSVGR